MNNGGSIRLRVGDLVHAIVKNKKMIITLTILGLVIGIALSGLSYLRGELSKQYLITASVVVASANSDGTYPASNTWYPRNEDVTMANNMVESAIYVLESDKTLNAVIEKNGLLGITAKDVASNLSLRRYNTTQIIEISLYWRSADEGVGILQTLTTEGRNVLQETLDIGKLTVVNEPNAKYLIGGNLNASLWLYMTFLGFALGVGISVLKYLIQPTLTNVRDVDDLFGLETLAVLPKNVGHFTRNGEKLVSEDGSSEVAEEFTSAVHILRNRLGSGEHKCVYVTSATHGEGKSAVTANLALALADLGYRTLLVDFDFRNPTMGQMFTNEAIYEHSFNALYRGEITELEAITPVTGYLDILPSIVERRGIIMDENTIGVVKRLSNNYDYVLMDTPPVGMVADAMSLNQVADSVVFVIRYDTATVAEIREALERLDKSGSRVAGCIVNGVTRAHEDRQWDDTETENKRKKKRAGK